MSRIWKMVASTCMIFAIVFRCRDHYAVTTAVAFWLLMMLPYVLISYYERYAWPSLPLQTIVVSAVFSKAFVRFATPILEV